MSDGNPFPFGRGGRGAQLLAALQNHPRRPGQSSPPSETPTEQSAKSSPSPPSETPSVMGRGAFLQSLLAQGRGRVNPAMPDPVPTKVSDPIPAQPLGRGRGLALKTLLSDSKTKSPDLPTASASSTSSTSVTTPPSVSGTTSPTPIYEPPTKELEELSIGKYKGTSGDHVQMEVNYVRLKTFKDKGIYEYHVSFDPPVDSKRMKFRLMADPSVKQLTGSVKTFDSSKLYLPLKLECTPTIVNVCLPTDNSMVTVSIKFIKRSSPTDCLHLYNLLFRKVMHILKMTQVGRNYFNPNCGIPVPQHRLEIWPGYVTAVQEYEDGVMLNCDASFRVLRTVTAYDLMFDASKSRGGNMRENAMKALIGCIVLTRYNNKTYKIDDISWDMNPMSSFVVHDGSSTTFVDYYKRSYDIDIKDIKQPLLINKAKKKDLKEGEQPRLICLIPELCFMTGLTDEMRNDFKVMKDVAVHTRVLPETRQLQLQKFINTVRENEDAHKVFASWNVELDMNPISLEGRVLKSEVLVFGRDVKIIASPEADWGRQATSNHVLVPVHLEKWVVVCTKRDSGKVCDFTKMMQNVCPSMGINVRPPHCVEIVNDRTETYCDAIRDILNPTVQIVVAIFPTPRDDRYSAVKKLCCIERPVPSQAINVRTISDGRKLRSVVQKIALQMNCKLGGELWAVNIPLSDLMVCGLDTYHDSQRGKRSVLAFVASINQNRTRWYSSTALQKQGQEVGDCLKMLFLNALTKYYEVNHKLPQRIILYRDGVGDGQMDFIAKYEVEQLTSCFGNFSDYSPTLSVVIVQKRINTRMYAIERGPRRALANPRPGSIVDHTVTRKKWYDFFLVSQHVRQGTVSPTHYVVIYDSSGMPPERMQRVTYKMTHLYYNWPGTVRVPAPCQYAHKLAYLVGQNLHKEAHVDLADRLFYL